MRTMICCLLTLLTTTALQAQDRIAWKFKKGMSFFIAETMDQKQVVSVAGMDQNNNTIQDTLTRFDILDTRPDGGVTVRMTFVEMKMKGANAAQSQVIFNRMIGSTFELTVDARQNVTKLTGYEDFVKRVADGNAGLEKIFRSMMSEDALKQIVRQTFTLLPGRDVREGETWNQSLAMSLGPMGAVDVTRTLKHAGRGRPKGVQTGEFCHLTMTGNATYKAPDPNAEGLPFKIEEGDLKMEDLKGTGYFDLETGMLHSMRVSLNMNGSLKIKIGAQSARVTLKQAQVLTATVTLEDPRVKQ